MKSRAWIIVALAGVAPLRAQDDLPKHAPGDGMDFEPKLMLDGPRASPVEAAPTPSAEDRVTELEATLRQAEQRAGGSEELYKEGVLAKVEVEARALRVVRIRKDLDDAQLAVAAAQTDAVKKSFDAHKASQADLDTANAALKVARQAAAAATAEWEKGRLDAATLDLARKRKLYSEGVCTKQDVEAAEDRLALLSGSSTR